MQEERGAIINKLKGYRYFLPLLYIACFEVILHVWSRAEFQAAKREREALEKQVEKLEGDKKQKLELERQTRMALEYKSIEEVDRRIKNVEHIIETESLDSKEERELLKQVQRLKASRKVGFSQRFLYSSKTPPFHPRLWKTMKSFGSPCSVRARRRRRSPRRRVAKVLVLVLVPVTRNNLLSKLLTLMPAET